MCYEEPSTRDPSVSFVELSLMFRFFELLIVAVQNLDVELVGCAKVV